jgi:PTH1 family peptidyl-tRNA hydrolase
VANFVLNKAPQREQQLINTAIDEAIKHQTLLINGELAQAMNQLNGYNANT